MENVNKRDEFSFLFLSLSPVPKKSTPRKFAHISHIQLIGITATKFGKIRIILKVTFSLPSPSSMLKLTNVEVAETSYQMLKVLSFFDQDRK